MDNYFHQKEHERINRKIKSFEESIDNLWTRVYTLVDKYNFEHEIKQLKEEIESLKK